MNATEFLMNMGVIVDTQDNIFITPFGGRQYDIKMLLELYGQMSIDEIETLSSVPCIKLEQYEIQSGTDRIKWAEGLISQLPPEHDGRNSWLLNYGRGDEAVEMREWEAILWVEDTQCAETRNATLERWKKVPKLSVQAIQDEFDMLCFEDLHEGYPC